MCIKSEGKNIFWKMQPGIKVIRPFYTTSIKKIEPNGCLSLPLVYGYPSLFKALCRSIVQMTHTKIRHFCFIALTFTGSLGRYFNICFSVQTVYSWKMCDPSSSIDTNAAAIQKSIYADFVLTWLWDNNPKKFCFPLAHYDKSSRFNEFVQLGRVKRIWYLSPMRASKVQARLCIRAVSPEPPLLAHTGSESRGTFRQKARSLAPLNGWACTVKICHDGMLEDTNSLDGAQLWVLVWYSKSTPLYYNDLHFQG